MLISCVQGHGCHHVIMAMMATFTNVFLWSSTPGLIRRPVDQLSFVVPWTPVRMFPQQVCLLRSSPPHHNPLYCRLYLCAVSFIFEDIFCFQMSFVMWSRFTPLGGLNMEHGQDVLSIWKWFVLFFLVLIPGHQFHAVFCVKSCDKREP